MPEMELKPREADFVKRWLSAQSTEVSGARAFTLPLNPIEPSDPETATPVVFAQNKLIADKEALEIVRQQLEIETERKREMPSEGFIAFMQSDVTELPLPQRAMKALTKRNTAKTVGDVVGMVQGKKAYGNFMGIADFGEKSLRDTVNILIQKDVPLILFDISLLDFVIEFTGRKKLEEAGFSDVEIERGIKQNTQRQRYVTKERQILTRRKQLTRMADQSLQDLGLDTALQHRLTDTWRVATEKDLINLIKRKGAYDDLMTTKDISTVRLKDIVTTLIERGLPLDQFDVSLRPIIIECIPRDILLERGFTSSEINTTMKEVRSRKRTQEEMERYNRLRSLKVPPQVEAAPTPVQKIETGWQKFVKKLKFWEK